MLTLMVMVNEGIGCAVERTTRRTLRAPRKARGDAGQSFAAAPDAGVSLCLKSSTPLAIDSLLILSS